MIINFKIDRNLEKYLFIIFWVFVYTNQSLAQSPKDILLYEESKNETASKCELYSSSELNTNSEVTFKIIISTDNPSPLGKYNQLGAGLATLIVPEDAYVDYKKIKVYYSIYPDPEVYKEYVPTSESAENWWKFVELAISKIPYLGMITDLKPLYEYSKPNYSNSIDANEYDIVNADWDSKKLEIWRRIKIEIPVKIGQNTKFGLYAYWLTKASNESGPVYKRENTITKGIINEKTSNQHFKSEINKKKSKGYDKSAFEENIKQYFRQKYGNGAESIISSMHAEYWDQNNDGINEARVCEKNIQGGDDRWYIFQYEPFKVLLENKVGWQLIMYNPHSQKDQTNGYQDCVLVTYERDNSGQIVQHQYLYKWNGSNYVPSSQLGSNVIDNSSAQNFSSSDVSSNCKIIASYEGTIELEYLNSQNLSEGQECEIYNLEETKLLKGNISALSKNNITIDVQEAFTSIKLKPGDEVFVEFK